MHDKLSKLPQEFYCDHLENINGIKFTPREIEVISCILNMRGASKIASFLYVATRAVESHVNNISKKLGGRTREKIIDFIESSDKASIIKNEYYQSLKMRSFFENKLKKSFSLIKSEKKCCIIEQSFEEHHFKLKKLLKEQLIKHLEITKIEAISYQDQHLQLEQISNSYDHIVLIISDEQLKQLDSALTQQANLTFIVLDQLTSVQKNVFNVTDYYYAFISILENCFCELNAVQAFEQEWRQYYENQNLHFNPEVRSENALTAIKPISLKRKWLLILFLVPSFFILFFIFKNIKTWTFFQEAQAIKSVPIPLDYLKCAAKLTSKIQEEFEKQRNDIKSLAIFGMGGAGKTTVARSYARQQQSDVIWEINAESVHSLMNSFEKLASVCAETESDKKILSDIRDIKEQKERAEKLVFFISKKLKNKQNWILIYDNVSNFSDVQQYFPNDSELWGKGKVIITTRDANIQNNRNINSSMKINELTQNEKLEYFTRVMYGDNPTHDQKEESKKFLENIVSFPLDIALTAYYLKSTNTSFEDYLERLEQHSKDFESMQGNILKESLQYAKTRYEIISISINNVIESHKDFADLLLFISLLDSQKIPRFLLNSYKNQAVIDSFIITMKKHSLITDSSPEYISIHRSVHATCLAHLKNCMQLNKNSKKIQEIAEILENYATKISDMEDFAKMREIIPHYEAFLKREDILSDYVIALLYSSLGQAYFYCSNDIQKAPKILEKSLLIFEKLGDEEKLAFMLACLGRSYTRTWDNEKAIDLLERSSAIYKQEKYKNQFGFVRVMDFLGIAYNKKGEYKKSVSAFEAGLEVCSKYFTNHLYHAAMLSNLAQIYTLLGDFNKAENLLGQAINIYKNHLPGHAGIVWSLCYLSDVYLESGEYKKAKDFIEESIAVFKKNFPEGYFMAVRLEAHLAKIYADLSEFNKAKEIFEKSIIDYEEHYGKDHLQVAQILVNLGSVYVLIGNIEKANELINRACDIFIQKNKPIVFNFINEFAIMPKEKKDFQELKKAANNCLKKSLIF